ncbi:MAG: hypothetical protein JSS78_01885 [Bacteroidetes bacterium]|nr:hypothetical protein [Bacteroidota bacterium]
MMTRDDRNDFSQHILSVSATMLGFSFLVFTSVNDGNFRYPGLTDIFATIAIVAFSTSTLLSFLSWRGRLHHKAYEYIADFVFLFGVLVICSSTLFMMFNRK